MKKTDHQINKTVAELHGGGVVSFPTETTYGIGCDPRNQKDVNRIFKLKGRDPKKPMLLIASSLAQVSRITNFHSAARRLARKYWPGALTLVLPVRKSAKLARGVTANGEVAIRFTSSKIAQQLVRRYGFPIIATSANRSGEPECRSAEKVQNIFKNNIDFVIDGGKLPKSKPSTVARVSKNGEVEVLREGKVVIIP